MPEHPTFKWKNIIFGLAVILLSLSIAYAANRRYKVRYHPQPIHKQVDKKYIKKPTVGKMYRSPRKRKAPCTCDTMIIVIQ